LYWTDEELMNAVEGVPFLAGDRPAAAEQPDAADGASHRPRW
jgi:hypothetical protein